MNAEKITAVEEFLKDWQQRLCQSIEAIDGGQKFRTDDWSYKGSGGGCTRVLEKGEVIEQGGVNFSAIRGKQLPQAATLQRPEIAGCAFQAMGVSTVIHPLNPYMPTSHANLRLIVVDVPSEQPVWWFGGGFDLTPYYGFKEDCQLWHQHAKQACEPFGAEIYPEFKRWCDEYFYLPHRREPRGIGGLFFDDLNRWGFDRCFEFVRAVGENYLTAYQTILQRRQAMKWGEREREFQLYRRGRYVEFNLLYDRGTLFGLQSKGRTESILMSLPPKVSWRYDYKPELGSAEFDLFSFLATDD